LISFFLSYSRSSDDERWRDWIKQELDRLGRQSLIDVWWQDTETESQRVQETFEARMQRELRASEYVLCIVSHAFLASPPLLVQTKQVDVDHLLPVLVEACDVPAPLAKIGHCKLFDASEDEARERFRSFISAFVPEVAGAAFPGKASNKDDEVNRPLAAGMMDASGVIALERVADSFGLSKTQLAEIVGLNRESLYKSTRVSTPKIQSRVKEMLEIVGRVSQWAGGRKQALAWYTSQPIPAFGSRTAESLVKSGQASALRDYLDQVAMGGFA
jgi:TIR domain